MRCFAGFSIFVVMMLVMAGCELHTTPHGDIYGYWQLVAVDTVGGASTDLGSRRVFWGIQNSLVQCGDYGGQTISVVSRFKQQHDSLLFEKLFFNDRPNGDPEVSDLADVAIYGFTSLKPCYAIEHLSEQRMTLYAQPLRLHFRKR